MSEEITKVINVKIKIDVDIDVGAIDDNALLEAKKKVSKMFCLVSMNLAAKIISYTGIEELTTNQLVEITCLIKYYTVMSMGKHMTSDLLNTDAGFITPLQTSNEKNKT